MDASARIAALARQLDEQQRALDDTRAELTRLTAGNSSPPTTTRRDWMRRAAVLSGATVATGIAAAAAGAGPAAADDGDPIKAGLQTNETTGTVVFVTGATRGHGAFTVTDTAFGSVPSSARPAAVVGIALSTTTGDAGVAGVGAAMGVYGVGQDYGVFGVGEAYGVFGKASGTGVVGVGAQVDGASCVGAQVVAIGAHSTGLRASGETGAHLTGTTHGAVATGGTGNGVSASGVRGGRFSGTAAAINLAPTKHASHPHSGSAGDFYVDHHHRLWFCKGGTTWVRLA